MTDSIPPASGSNMATSTTVAVDLAHDAERDARHGLAHLEDEFLAQVKRLPLLTADLEEAAKKLLAWIAGRI